MFLKQHICVMSYKRQQNTDSKSKSVKLQKVQCVVKTLLSLSQKHHFVTAMLQST